MGLSVSVCLSVRPPLVEGDGPAVLREQLAARSLGGTRRRSHGGVHLGGLPGLLHLGGGMFHFTGICDILLYLLLSDVFVDVSSL